jgi:cyclic-di-AMP phosphodiesterase
MFSEFDKIKRQTLYFFGIEASVIILGILARTFLGGFFPFLLDLDFVYFYYTAIIGFNIYFIIYVFMQLEKGNKRSYGDIQSALGSDLSEAFLFGQIGILMYDQSRNVVWSSELFEERNIDCIGENILVYFPGLKPLMSESLEAANQANIDFKGRTYEVLHMRELNVLIFKDVDEIAKLYQVRNDQSPVFLTLIIDNLVDVNTISKEEAFNQAEIDVRKAILEWSKRMEILTRKFKDDTYFGLTTEGNFLKIIKSEFSILKEVKDLSKNLTIPLSISIGIGRGTYDYFKISELSNNAIDVALSRGGGQVVINNYGSSMEFFGGGEDVKTKKNSVRSRVLAQSFYTHIENSKFNLIATHDNADFDAVGSALGIYFLIKSSNRDAKIVCELSKMDIKTRLAVKDLLTKEEIDDIFISQADGLKLLDDKTLVTLVDVNRSKLTTCPKIIEVAKNIAVVDHHRKAEDAIDNPIFSLIETTSSSTSELAVELIKYNRKNLKIPSKFSTMLLTGILLDTNGFKVNTNPDTFEAAMILKGFGADNSKANGFLKDEYEEYLLKTKIMNNAETVQFGVVVATSDEETIIDRTILARVGQDAMGVKGIKAIFVIGKIGVDQIGISARSDGSVNVQLIMEKIGGGGHFSSAAAQIKDKKVIEVKNEVKKLIEIYQNEAKAD